MSLEREVVIVMNKLVLLDFWAPWCGYCLEMNATVEVCCHFCDKKYVFTAEDCHKLFAEQAKEEETESDSE